MPETSENLQNPEQNGAQDTLFCENGAASSENKEKSATSSATEDTSEIAENNNLNDKNAGEVCDNTEKTPFSSENDQKTAKNDQTSDPVDEISSLEAHISRDLSAFIKKYPNVSPSTLVSDECLILYAQGRENEDFSRIYSNYLTLCRKIEENATKKASFELMARESTPGSLSCASTLNDGFFTKEQVLRMSSEEIKRNYDKIRKSQQHW